MKKQKKIQRDSAKANHSVLIRILILMGLFGVLFFIPMFGRLFYLQIVQHEELESKAIDQQTYDRSVVANRGTIYDSKGNTLAMSATAYDVQLSPLEILECQEAYQEQVEKAQAAETAEEREKLMPSYPEPTNESIAQTLSQLLGLDQESILQRLSKTNSMYEIIAKQVDEDVADQISAYASENGLSRGIYLNATAKRYYPYSTLAAQIVGWVNYNDGNRGAYGLEAMYDDILAGQTGRVVTAKDGHGKQMLYRYEDYYDATDGYDLTLTLDATIQYYCERVLAEGIEKYEVQDGGFVIAMEPKTGRILAWANSPTYDLNDPRTVIDSRLQAELTAIAADTTLTDEERSTAQTEVLFKQWSNKALNETYEPGSTFKTTVLAAALEEGVVNENSTFYCPGYAIVADRHIWCSDHKGHKDQTLAKAVANSCNPAFIEIGQALGAETFYDYLEAFGFKDKTGIDLQGEPTPNDNLIWPREEFTSPIGLTSLATASFGQRFKITPLQLITAASAVINGGHLMRPYVMESITDADGNVIQHTEPTEVRQVVSESTSERCRTILEGVVDGGTGKQAYVAGYRIGGKTGSSETDEDDHTIVSFLGFAPANDPQVVVLIAYDNPTPTGPNSNYTSGGHYISGGNMAAPMAGELLADILDYMGVEKQYTDAEKAAMDMTVPNVTGLTLSEATARLAESNLEVRTVGSGDTVTDQIPAQGVAIPGGSQVILYMGSEKPTDKVAVPDLSGMNREQAQTALTNVGLYLKSTGDTTSESVRAESQSIAAGTEVEMGMVVEVHFVGTTATGGAGSGT
ncbi:penicillin-binding transpeptidase domain-containing protein [Pseudoflavonifractor phocaeensis]|uniref:penicillin-binding transpeptidase domain-containing protein n=1 Tax=Pseudoflavonifractor phocaeensis TaxID=1870988 RepID=UPI00195DEAB7|nr:penicillin-binding transpeptidase domain-containing protein [Pseudoflavonifractor phocaeensis]MBM6869396.1 PASTA domain-containing protein [Pseudoflavonifractor phocaeensis]